VFMVHANEKGMNIAHTCSCGEKHNWPMYVFAHWQDGLKHTCEKCGSKTFICEGICEHEPVYKEAD
jgi:hypothetical protein